MYQALLHATKFSLNQMKERICGRRNQPKQVLKPFFEVDVHLEGDACNLKPSLEEVQVIKVPIDKMEGRAYGF